ncbi:pirin family protein [Chryseobacterium shandongense]|uniref:pirin family protein n=1 Tax=Chryseobacterium shandongense TaxID=1493872 RepID=UPI0037435499
MDHGGPVDIPTAIHSNLDVLPHPHIGLSTVSYLFSGEIMHRDSLGIEQAIKPVKLTG